MGLHETNPRALPVQSQSASAEFVSVPQLRNPAYPVLCHFYILRVRADSCLPRYMTAALEPRLLEVSCASLRGPSGPPGFISALQDPCWNYEVRKSASLKVAELAALFKSARELGINYKGSKEPPG